MNKEPWSRFFIVDSSVVAVQGLRFGRGFIGFQEDGNPLFGSRPENVKLYTTLEECKVDYNKINEQIIIYNIVITLPGQVSYSIIEKK